MNRDRLERHLSKRNVPFLLVLADGAVAACHLSLGPGQMLVDSLWSCPSCQPPTRRLHKVLSCWQLRKESCAVCPTVSPHLPSEAAGLPLHGALEIPCQSHQGTPVGATLGLPTTQR